MSERFQMLAYSGAALESLFWGRIMIDLEGISTPPKLPALREHERARPVGVVDAVLKSRDGLIAEGYFLSTSDGQECRDLLLQGYPMQSSIGVWAGSVEEIKAGEKGLVNGQTFIGPGAIWRTSQVREISFVSLGADGNTSVSIAAAALTREEWDSNPALRREFGQIETFLAFKRAEAAGLIDGASFQEVSLPPVNLEAKAREEWDLNPELKAEFHYDFALYVAFRKAEQAGQVRILRGPVVTTMS